MNESKARIVISTILGKVSSILGYFIIVIMVLAFIGGEPSIPEEDYVADFIITIIGLLLIFNGIIIKRRIKRFKTYVGLISIEQITSLENLASSTSQSMDFVRKDLQKMIDKKFFTNAHIDSRTNEIVIGSPTPQPATPIATQPAQPNVVIENENVKCPGCGAMNMKQAGVATFCEYCGSPIK